MIHKDYYQTRKDGVKLFITYSDEGMFITKKGKGFKYRWAIDVESADYKYVETSEPIKYDKEEKAVMEKLGSKYWLPTMKIELAVE